MTFFQYVISIQVPDRDYKKHDRVRKKRLQKIQKRLCGIRW